MCEYRSRRLEAAHSENLEVVLYKEQEEEDMETGALLGLHFSRGN